MLGELTAEEIEEVLRSNAVGRIGCASQQKIYVVPVTYGYDGESIIGHTIEGMKVEILRQNPECCFEVDVLKDLSNWVSVITWGTFEELTGDEASKAVDFLMKRVAPLMPGETSHPPRMGPSPSLRQATFQKNPIIYRIRLKEKSGRFERH
jgi:nitroimidazol reductase NimA-like FMN-containing flavoprotein (pyridoxamine 5'-phosphate oxidase superfamily)